MTRNLSPAEHWSRRLGAWALPEEVLSSVEQSPYAWPAKVFARTAQRRPDPITGPLMRNLLPAAGSLLDVGAGTGRLCLPVAGEGHEVVAVEPNGAMADELEALAAGTPGSVRVIRMRWPEASATAGRHEVVVTANVVYDVAEIGPFVTELDRSATVAVVVELTRRHPWEGLRGYYRRLHGVHLPDGPTVDDLIAVIADAVGIEPHRRDWPSPPPLAFESRDALLELYRVRLCVPAARRADLEALLDDDIEVRDDGDVVLRTPPTGMSTLWWGRGLVRGPGHS